MSKAGFHFVHEDEDGQKFESEHWYFGEVDKTDDGSEEGCRKYKISKIFWDEIRNCSASRCPLDEFALPGTPHSHPSPLCVRMSTITPIAGETP
jgi:hypothetical protein